MCGPAAVSVGLYHGTCLWSEDSIAEGGFTGSKRVLVFLAA